MIFRTGTRGSPIQSRYLRQTSVQPGYLASQRWMYALRGKLNSFYLFIRLARERKLEDGQNKGGWRTSVAMKAAPSPFKLLTGMTRVGWTFEPEPSQHPLPSILTIPDACLSRCFIQELDAFDGFAMLRWRSSGLATIFWKLQDVGFRVKTSTFEGIIAQIFIVKILCKSHDWLINYFLRYVKFIKSNHGVLGHCVLRPSLSWGFFWLFGGTEDDRIGIAAALKL